MMEKTKSLNKELFFSGVRQLIYVISILSLILALRGVSYYYKTATFSENSIVENLQISLLGLTGIIFALSAFKYAKYKALFLFFASLTLFALLRELDHFCDHYIPIFSWKFAYLFPVFSLINMWRERKNVIEMLNYFLASPTFHLMVLGLVIALPIAQAVGDKRLVSNIVAPEQIPIVKEMFEETCELIGYFTLFLSSIESFFWWKRKA